MLSPCRSTILLLLLPLILLLPIALARPRDYFGLQPTALVKDDQVTNRQATRTKILRRTRVRETRNKINEAHQRWLGPGLGLRPGQLGRVLKRSDDIQGGSTEGGVVGRGSKVQARALGARASIVPRMKKRANVCQDGTEGREGWARYEAWELEFDDIPGGAIYVSDETLCINACLSYGSGCAGAQYLPTNDGPTCYLKAPAYNTGRFSDETYEALSTGSVLNLVGSCDIWDGIVPEEMDKVCCGV